MQQPTKSFCNFLYLRVAKNSHDSVPLAADMFFNAYSVCHRFGVAGVRDSRGNLVGAITNALSLYRHLYENKAIRNRYVKRLMRR